MKRRAAALLLGLAACATAHGRSENNVVSTRYSPLSRGEEMAQRTLPPLALRRMSQALAAKQARLAEQSIDLSKEKFDLYIPLGAPPAAGWGLVVFASPGSAPTRPSIWRPTLDRHRMIFISAQNAGNDKNLFDRRVPMTLLAYENARARYPIDPKRVYVVGYSGGGRVAEIVALSYPDVFRGVVVHAGADPIDGAQGVYKPTPDRMRLFQHNRLVYVHGDRDEENRILNEISRESMHRACMLNITNNIARNQGHDFLDAAAMDLALDAVDVPGTVDEAQLARCNERVQRELRVRLDEARATIARGEVVRARRQLDAIDAEFGGLAGSEVVELESRLPAP